MWIEAGLLFSGSSGFGRLRMPDLRAKMIIMMMIMNNNDNDRDNDDNNDNDCDDNDDDNDHGDDNYY